MLTQLGRRSIPEPHQEVSNYTCPLSDPTSLKTVSTVLSKCWAVGKAGLTAGMLHREGTGPPPSPSLPCMPSCLLSAWLCCSGGLRGSQPQAAAESCLCSQDSPLAQHLHPVLSWWRPEGRTGEGKSSGQIPTHCCPQALAGQSGGQAGQRVGEGSGHTAGSPCPPETLLPPLLLSL